MRNNGSELSQTDVGKIMGISKARVSQLEERAIGQQLRWYDEVSIGALTSPSGSAGESSNK